MEDEIAAIRARHEAWEASTISVGSHAHTDRATLLRALDEAQERAERAEEALRPFAEFERVIRNSYAEWPDDRDFYRYNDAPILLGDLRRAAQTLKERNDG